MLKRLFDIIFSLLGLLLLWPLFLVVGLMVKFQDGGPAFFRQTRIGRNGQAFRLIKFRSMRVESSSPGPSITADGDPRITAVGRFIRKTKIDELPQLLNVVLGNMSFVGPRPEVPKYVGLYTEEQRAVLKLRPGITDLASIEFRKEEELLASAEDPEKFYREYCLPTKIELNLRHARRAGLIGDLIIIFKTLFPFLHRREVLDSESGKPDDGQA
jgi:lipopolysaccharide/colanic/teichoic acid biosynthesis glycosyltransferase